LVWGWWAPARPQEGNRDDHETTADWVPVGVERTHFEHLSHLHRGLAETLVRRCSTNDITMAKRPVNVDVASEEYKSRLVPLHRG
jgi:hypothetical protein